MVKQQFAKLSRAWVSHRFKSCSHRILRGIRDSHPPTYVGVIDGWDLLRGNRFHPHTWVGNRFTIFDGDQGIYQLGDYLLWE